MTTGVTPEVRFPKTVKTGDVFAVKTVINHKMEPGHRFDRDGTEIPRSIINRFTCDYGGENVIDVTFEPAISNNPVVDFQITAVASGPLNFTWYDDDGDIYRLIRTVSVD